MRPGREIDCRVAQEVFGHEIFVKKKILHEKTPLGERPLRKYDQEIEDAWLIAEKMYISLVAIQGGEWFAFAGANEGWESPTAFLKYLEAGDFSLCGASVHKKVAKAICEAALKAAEKRRFHENRAVVDSAAEAANETSIATH